MAGVEEGFWDNSSDWKDIGTAHFFKKHNRGWLGASFARRRNLLGIFCKFDDDESSGCAIL